MKIDLMNIIFGLKVRKARSAMGLSLSAFAKQVGLSPSYLTEIEKGRKYPKRDKIFRIATFTGIDYDQLVSIRLDPSLAYLESALASPLLSEFPFDEFGIELGSLVEILTNAPARTSALIQALLEIGRRYDMKEEHFLRAALRSYQEMHDNHFPDLEEAAEAAAQEYALMLPLDQQQLEAVLCDQFGYSIDYDSLADIAPLQKLRSVVVTGKSPKLLINHRLLPGQIKFLIAREIGHQRLQLKSRAYTSPPQVVGSFEQVFNDFRASYFAGALMMPREPTLRDVEELFCQKTWQPQRLLAMLQKYDVSAEMWCYRLSELIPEHFGVDLHFLRFTDQDGRYRLVKQLNFNNLPLPNGFGLNEHYCRRWLTTRLLREMEGRSVPAGQPHVGAQISEFLHSDSRFFCMGFGRSLALQPNVKTSVILGFRMNSTLAETIHFIDDPNIPHTVITNTCERCPLTWSQCAVRATEPTIWRSEQHQREQRAALNTLVAELRS